ncbi:hypothetical protein [Candidatus Xianfuyuplasma coldseepsis]|uniref:Uncharacterized protein n=1 Tax=Candidatus Xianfuyuplasma coldseepsis TaxID=2782163 RepID=A0A7L7KPC0_9MOLU|nr:hypothetical protein [Xianfuyuplasma coldseepsis]QMS84507.1 hypothetical protein G4Z02_01670 [Xianfuyuplasma coldseepsis]
MPSYIVVPLLLFAVIGLYIVSYSLNKNTKTPEGVETLGKCSTCGSGSCSLAGTNVPEPKDNCEVDYNLNNQ